MQRDIELVRVADFVGGDQPGPKRLQRVGALALGPLRAALELKDALGYVIADAEARDMTHGIFYCDIRPCLAEDHGEFGLPIELCAALGHHHRVGGSVDGAGRGHHEHGLLGRLEARLGGMLAIGEGAANDFSGPEHRRAEARLRRQGG